ncbi:hypothetical protein Hanom_Chr08g00721121 [Helianthus anomalus]
MKQPTPPLSFSVSVVNRSTTTINRWSKALIAGRSIYPVMVVSDDRQTVEPSDRRPEAPETAVVSAMVWFEFWFRRVHISSRRVWVQSNKFKFR